MLTIRSHMRQYTSYNTSVLLLYREYPDNWLIHPESHMPRCTITQEVSEIKIGIYNQYVDDVKGSNVSPGTQKHFEIATSSWMVLWPIDPWRFVHSRCGFYVLVVFWVKRVGNRYNILYHNLITLKFKESW